MAMLQHYYTSCLHGTSGGAGFQCQAMSPGISANDLKAINSLLSYRIPPSLDERDIERHPVALRYDYLGPDKCILICSQSNGNDENGRPGNFFAHSIVTSPKDFEVFPPIMYWRHPFWLTHDDSGRVEIPIEPDFNLSPSLKLEHIWPFLDHGNRRDWFYKLLCAVIQFDQAKRPIVILDDVDNIALWIASVTVALPQIYRHFLTFATYHHDPYQVPFLITGTTADSKFRFSSDEYISYFVLNADDKRVSDIADSDYARLIFRNFQPDLYESKLLDFFETCKHRLPTRRLSNLGAILETIANFYLTIRERDLHLSNPKAQQGLYTFIQYLEGESELLPEDLDDLIATVDVIGGELTSAPALSLIEDYGKALRLLKKNHPEYARQAKKDVELLGSLLSRANEDMVNSLLSTYRDIYQDDMLTQVLSQPEFLIFLESQASPGSWQIHYLIWTYLLPLVRYDARTYPYIADLLHKTMFAVDSLPAAEADLPSPESEKLLNAIVLATRNNQRFLLETGMAWQQKHAGNAFMWLYYKLVGHLPIADRKAYRNMVSNVIPSITLYEVSRDVRARGISNAAPLLEEWIDYSNGNDSQRSLLVTHGIETAWRLTSAEKRVMLAESVLTSPKIIGHLDATWMGKLLTSIVAEKSFRILGSQALKIYDRCLSHPSLSPEQRAIIGGSLAMSTGHYVGTSVPDIQKWLAVQDEIIYQREADKLIRRSFEKGINLEAHRDTLRATYAEHHQKIFWDMYWTYFKKLMRDRERVQELASLFSFWFDESLRILVEYPYLCQSFFLQLPSAIEEVKQEKEFKRVARLLSHHANRYPWYSLLDHYFVPKEKKKLFGLLGR
jgi:hypothetical protein